MRLVEGFPRQQVLYAWSKGEWLGSVGQQCLMLPRRSVVNRVGLRRSIPRLAWCSFDSYEEDGSKGGSIGMGVLLYFSQHKIDVIYYICHSRPCCQLCLMLQLLAAVYHRIPARGSNCYNLGMSIDHGFLFRGRELCGAFTVRLLFFFNCQPVVDLVDFVGVVGVLCVTCCFSKALVCILDYGYQC